MSGAGESAGGADHLESLARRAAGTAPGLEPRELSRFLPGQELRAAVEGGEPWPGRAVTAPPPDGSTPFADADGEFPPLVGGAWTAESTAPSLAAILGSGPLLEPAAEPQLPLDDLPPDELPSDEFSPDESSPGGDSAAAASEPRASAPDASSALSFAISVDGGAEEGGAPAGDGGHGESGGRAEAIGDTQRAAAADARPASAATSAAGEDGTSHDRRPAPTISAAGSVDAVAAEARSADAASPAHQADASDPGTRTVPAIPSTDARTEAAPPVATGGGPAADARAAYPIAPADPLDDAATGVGAAAAAPLVATAGGRTADALPAQPIAPAVLADGSGTGTETGQPAYSTVSDDGSTGEARPAQSAAPTGGAIAGAQPVQLAHSAVPYGEPAREALPARPVGATDSTGGGIDDAQAVQAAHLALHDGRPAGEGRPVQAVVPAGQNRDAGSDALPAPSVVSAAPVDGVGVGTQTFSDASAASPDGTFVRDVPPALPIAPAVLNVDPTAEGLPAIVPARSPHEIPADARSAPTVPAADVSAKAAADAPAHDASPPTRGAFAPPSAGSSAGVANAHSAPPASPLDPGDRGVVGTRSARESDTPAQAPSAPPSAGLAEGAAARSGAPGSLLGPSDARAQTLAEDRIDAPPAGAPPMQSGVLADPTTVADPLTARTATSAGVSGDGLADTRSAIVPVRPVGAPDVEAQSVQSSSTSIGDHVPAGGSSAPAPPAMGAGPGFVTAEPSGDVFRGGLSLGAVGPAIPVQRMSPAEPTTRAAGETPQSARVHADTVGSAPLRDGDRETRSRASEFASERDRRTISSASEGAGASAQASAGAATAPKVAVRESQVGPPGEPAPPAPEHAIQRIATEAAVEGLGASPVVGARGGSLDITERDGGSPQVDRAGDRSALHVGARDGAEGDTPPTSALVGPAIALAGERESAAANVEVPTVSSSGDFPPRVAVSPAPAVWAGGAAAGDVIQPVVVSPAASGGAPEIAGGGSLVPPAAITPAVSAGSRDPSGEGTSIRADAAAGIEHDDAPRSPASDPTPPRTTGSGAHPAVDGGAPETSAAARGSHAPSAEPSSASAVGPAVRAEGPAIAAPAHSDPSRRTSESASRPSDAIPGALRVGQSGIAPTASELLDAAPTSTTVDAVAPPPVRSTPIAPVLAAESADDLGARPSLGGEAVGVTAATYVAPSTGPADAVQRTSAAASVTDRARSEEVAASSVAFEVTVAASSVVRGPSPLPTSLSDAVSEVASAGGDASHGQVAVDRPVASSDPRAGALPSAPESSASAASIVSAAQADPTRGARAASGPARVGGAEVHGLAAAGSTVEIPAHSPSAGPTLRPAASSESAAQQPSTTEPLSGPVQPASADASSADASGSAAASPASAAISAVDPTHATGGSESSSSRSVSQDREVGASTADARAEAGSSSESLRSGPSPTSIIGAANELGGTTSTAGAGSQPVRRSEVVPADAAGAEAGGSAGPASSIIQPRLDSEVEGARASIDAATDAHTAGGPVPPSPQRSHASPGVDSRRSESEAGKREAGTSAQSGSVAASAAHPPVREGSLSQPGAKPAEGARSVSPGSLSTPSAPTAPPPAVVPPAAGAPIQRFVDTSIPAPTAPPTASSVAGGGGDAASLLVSATVPSPSPVAGETRSVGGAPQEAVPTSPETTATVMRSPQDASSVVPSGAIADAVVEQPMAREFGPSIEPRAPEISRVGAGVDVVPSAGGLVESPSPATHSAFQPSDSQAAAVAALSASVPGPRDASPAAPPTTSPDVAAREPTLAAPSYGAPLVPGSTDEQHARPESVLPAEALDVPRETAALEHARGEVSPPGTTTVGWDDSSRPIRGSSVVPAADIAASQSIAEQAGATSDAVRERDSIPKESSGAASGVRHTASTAQPAEVAPSSESATGLSAPPAVSAPERQRDPVPTRAAEARADAPAGEGGAQRSPGVEAGQGGRHPASSARPTEGEPRGRDAAQVAGSSDAIDAIPAADVLSSNAAARDPGERLAAASESCAGDSARAGQPVVAPSLLARGESIAPREVAEAAGAAAMEAESASADSQPPRVERMHSPLAAAATGAPVASPTRESSATTPSAPASARRGDAPSSAELRAPSATPARDMAPVAAQAGGTPAGASRAAPVHAPRQVPAHDARSASAPGSARPAPPSPSSAPLSSTAPVTPAAVSATSTQSEHQASVRAAHPAGALGSVGADRSGVGQAIGAREASEAQGAAEHRGAIAQPVAARVEAPSAAAVHDGAREHSAAATSPRTPPASRDARQGQQQGARASGDAARAAGTPSAAASDSAAERVARPAAAHASPSSVGADPVQGAKSRATASPAIAAESTDRAGLQPADSPHRAPSTSSRHSDAEGVPRARGSMATPPAARSEPGAEFIQRAPVGPAPSRSIAPAAKTPPATPSHRPVSTQPAVPSAHRPSASADRPEAAQTQGTVADGRARVAKPGEPRLTSPAQANDNASAAAQRPAADRAVHLPHIRISRSAVTPADRAAVGAKQPPAAAGFPPLAAPTAPVAGAPSKGALAADNSSAAARVPAAQPGATPAAHSAGARAGAPGAARASVAPSAASAQAVSKSPAAPSRAVDAKAASAHVASASLADSKAAGAAASSTRAPVAASRATLAPKTASAAAAPASRTVALPGDTSSSSTSPVSATPARAAAGSRSPVAPRPEGAAASPASRGVASAGAAAPGSPAASMTARATSPASIAAPRHASTSPTPPVRSAARAALPASPIAPKVASSADSASHAGAKIGAATGKPAASGTAPTAAAVAAVASPPSSSAAAGSRAQPRPARTAAAHVLPAGMKQEATERAFAAAVKEADADPSPVTIEIGRVEVRATPPAAAQRGPRPKRQPMLTLERYLRQGGRR